jgi:hypothetical protein
MAYAGICGAEDLQPHSDPYFHTRSFDQIIAKITGTSCAVQTATGNNPPVVNAGAAITIPASTPFSLTGSATDPEGDTLTYCWEEFDHGTAAPPNTDDGSRAIFRSFNPVASPTRTFPKASDLLTGTSTIGESLPNTTRTMSFRLTARDNRAGGGGVSYATRTVNVSNAGGIPFAVTAPNSAVTWSGGTSQLVTWDVAGTSGAPVSCANVAITLSTDGGSTFPITLAASTPNDGSELILVPSTPTASARAMVACATSPFFDVSNTNFTITALVPPSATRLYPVTPCRIFDTRNASGADAASPILVAGATRTFSIGGRCSVPGTARSLSVNVTVTGQAASGDLVLYRADLGAAPITTGISFAPGLNRANNALLELDGTGAFKVLNRSAGVVHFILDVNGYLQ